MSALAIDILCGAAPAAMKSLDLTIHFSPQVLLAAGLLAVGIVLILAEIALPTHGALGLLGGLSLLGCVGACLVINAWLGLAVLVAMIVATPLAWSAFVNIWPRTPVGRRLVLSEVSGKVNPDAAVRIGQRGVAVSELRPWGECDIEGERVEAMSEQGMLPPGTAVKVVALVDRRAVVRAISRGIG